jgi:hypothetical protein
MALALLVYVADMAQFFAKNVSAQYMHSLGNRLNLLVIAQTCPRISAAKELCDVADQLSGFFSVSSTHHDNFVKVQQKNGLDRTLTMSHSCDTQWLSRSEEVHKQLPACLWKGWRLFCRKTAILKRDCLGPFKYYLFHFFRCVAVRAVRLCNQGSAKLRHP